MLWKAIFRSPSQKDIYSAQLHGVVIQELVGRKLQVLGSRSLSHAASEVIVGSMAWAEVSTIVSGIGLWDAAQVRAHTNTNQPLRALAALGIGGWLTHGGRDDIILPGRSNLLGGAPANEDRLGAPLHREVLPNPNGAQVNLHHAGSEDILGGPQREDQLASNRSDD